MHPPYPIHQRWANLSEDDGERQAGEGGADSCSQEVVCDCLRHTLEWRAIPKADQELLSFPVELTEPSERKEIAACLRLDPVLGKSPRVLAGMAMRSQSVCASSLCRRIDDANVGATMKLLVTST